ncbi:isochorismatase family protein [Streptomyces sp. NPDC101227]|uniref:isochorismatase family protein n=1 Tax=Streptomyces sp. NPDC101227 TaxID=3366136 RepID=UPI00380F460B
MTEPTTPLHTDARPRPRPVEALIVVDVQTAFVSGGDAVPDADRVLDRSRDLIARARAAGALVVHLQNDGPSGAVDEPHTPGWELHLPVEPGPLEHVVRKTDDDGFEDTPLGTLLADAGVQALALCGVLSEMCVSATARTALATGFRVVLPHDAHATYDIPAAPGISDLVPAAMSARAAEWALGDEIEITAHSADATFTGAPRGASVLMPPPPSPVPVAPDLGDRSRSAPFDYLQ